MSNDKSLAAALTASCERLVALALTCPRGGGAAWDQQLAQLGARRLSDEDRDSHLREGAPLGRGPLPIEMRWALECLALVDANAWEDTGRAPAIVQEALRSYLAAAKPAVSTSSIFANAMATTRTYANTSAGTETLRCLTCGAPRMHGRTELSCGYCGSADFSTA